LKDTGDEEGELKRSSESYLMIEKRAETFGGNERKGEDKVSNG